MYKYQVEPED